MSPSFIIKKMPSGVEKRNFLGRSEEAIRDHFQKMGMVLLETEDSLGRRHIEINEFQYYKVRYLLVNNICRWIHEEYDDDERLESLKRKYSKIYQQVNNHSWVEFSPRTDYLHTLNYCHSSLTLSHFLALCFVPGYNLIGFKLSETKHWLKKNKEIIPTRIPDRSGETEAWMAFWHGVGMVIEVNKKKICSRIIFYLPGGYKDFLEDLMNEYLVPGGENLWLQDYREMYCSWQLVKDTGSEFWELYLTEFDTSPISLSR